ncbi:MAG: DUF2975 domain-containing protein [Alphaproteobacteria bacterium]|nr:DUF2975 domain-containing protein [Alphaproteobacteria bacterium]
MKALGKGSIASIVKIGLDVLWIILWIAAFAVGAAALTYMIVSAMAAAGILPDAVFEEGQIKVADGQIQIVSDEGGAMDWRVLVPALLVGCVAVAGSLAVVWRLKRLFCSFTAGEPFAPENARHLRAIWIILVAVEIARYATMLLFGIIIVAAGVPEGVDLEVNIDLSAWFLILVIIVLAEVFREGARLHEEQKLTI